MKVERGDRLAMKGIGTRELRAESLDGDRLSKYEVPGQIHEGEPPSPDLLEEDIPPGKDGSLSRSFQARRTGQSDAGIRLCRIRDLLFLEQPPVRLRTNPRPLWLGIFDGCATIRPPDSGQGATSLLTRKRIFLVECSFVFKLRLLEPR